MFRGSVCSRNCRIVQHRKAIVDAAPAGKPVRGCVRPPGSKSITNRALVCAALAKGTSTLTGALDSEDTRVMIDSLRRLGIDVESRETGTTLIVHGCGGKIPASSAELFVGNSGTTIRFLTAMCASGTAPIGSTALSGCASGRLAICSMHCSRLGVECRGELRNGFPPVVVAGKRACAAAKLTMRGRHIQSVSQRLADGGAVRRQRCRSSVEGELVSKPYVAMTLAIMQAFGVACHADEFNAFSTSPMPMQIHEHADYAIEPDASAASYFWAAAAITGGEVTVEGLTKRFAARRRARSSSAWSRWAAT